MMKICICSSLTFTNETTEVAKMLEKLGYEVLLPNGIINHLTEQPEFDPVQTKLDTDSVHVHVDKIRSADAVLICNFLKDCTPGYIGANSFAELFAARYFNKPIYALFPLPNQPYINEELKALDITVINHDFSKLPVPKWAYSASVDTEQTTTTDCDNPKTIYHGVNNQEPASEENSAAKEDSMAKEEMAKKESTETASASALSDLEPWHPWSALREKIASFKFPKH